MKTIEWDGQPITKPGMYSGIDIDLYHAAGICVGPSLSSGGMRKIVGESPAHFFDSWRGNPNRKEPAKEPRHFLVGRATHHLHLGQAKFSEAFAIQPAEYEAETGEMKPWNNNANDCRFWHAQRKAEGKSVITEAEAEVVVGMAKELKRCPIIAHGALNGLVERSIFWKDKKTGIWLKSRPDVIPNESGDFVDYKTTQSVQWGKLVYAIEDFGYHQQGALVREAAREVLEIDNPSFSLVFQEKERPFAVRVVTLKDHTLDLGAKLNRKAIDLFAAGIKTGHWPGPGGDQEDAEPIELSENARQRAEDYLLIHGGERR